MTAPELNLPAEMAALSESLAAAALAGERE